MNYQMINIVLIFVLIISCKNPITRNRITVGDADYSAEIAQVGSNLNLAPPENVKLENNATAEQKYLMLRWDLVPGATSYRVYRAVYPTHTYTSGLPDRSFKRLIELDAHDYHHKDVMEFRNDLPSVPLRRYAYRVTAVNEEGESAFSNMVEGYRLPVDEKEALEDMDYTIHFAQSSIPGFGQMGLKTIVPGRASGTYYYASEMTNIKSQFDNYADFETILNGNPKLSVTLNPIGTKMNGNITASGLYHATMTYNNLIGVVGGLTKGGSISITYLHPVLGSISSTYGYQEAEKFMKSVATQESDVQGPPAASEWDEANPGYVRSARESALRSVRSME